MAEVTVQEFAGFLRIPVDKLVAQLQEAGIDIEGPNDRITEDAKLELLTYLRKLQAEEQAANPRKITLRRR